MKMRRTLLTIFLSHLAYKRLQSRSHEAIFWVSSKSRARACRCWGRSSCQTWQLAQKDSGLKNVKSGQLAYVIFLFSYNIAFVCPDLKQSTYLFWIAHTGQDLKIPVVWPEFKSTKVAFLWVLFISVIFISLCKWHLENHISSCNVLCSLLSKFTNVYWKFN